MHSAPNAAQLFRRLATAVVLCLGLGLLAACDSAEERAEKHFQAGMALLEKGDVDRALIEFRNVFKLNGKHKEARLVYARTQLKRGKFQDAYSQFLRLVEQYPDNLEGRRTLAQLALFSGNFDEAERHGSVAAKLAPEDTLVQSVNNSIAYHRALEDRDQEARIKTVEKARELLSSNPELFSAWQVWIDDNLRKEQWDEALAAIDGALASVSWAEDQLFPTRLKVLQKIGDVDAIETQLKKMLAKAPDNAEIKQALADLYVSQDRIDEAEEFLRSQVDPASPDTSGIEQLVGFIRTFQGEDAAIAELDRIISGGGDNERAFRAIRAKLRFASGDQQTAIEEMEALVRDADRTSLTRKIEVDLAFMLWQTGDPAGSRALVERVLQEDRTNIAAIKLKARWLIDDDATGEAIVLLREGLGQAPRDEELLTLMAAAHERNGNRQLQGEMLALAVEASQGAPAETLRYAAFLTEDEDFVTAEDVLLESLRLHPRNTALLGALGRLYIRMEDWKRIEAVVSSLQQIGTPEADATAKELTAQELAAQQRADELTKFLDNLSKDSQLGSKAEIALIRAFIAKDDVTGALERLDTALADKPDSVALRYLKGFALALAEQPDHADEVYRALLTDHPQLEDVWLARYQLQSKLGDSERARAILEEALAAVPDGRKLNWAKAGELEKAGDIEGAISIYETLYALDSRSRVIANNLASLLASHRDDPESLERAFVIAKRLGGTTYPPYQDTYGWIAYRRGDLDTALNYLEPASRGLPDDPYVQYHLAKTYAAIGQTADAIAAFRKALTLADSQPNVSFIEDARSEISRLSAAASSGSNNN